MNRRASNVRRDNNFLRAKRNARVASKRGFPGRASLRPGDARQCAAGEENDIPRVNERGRGRKA